MPKLIVLIDAELDATLTTFEKQENRLANKGKPFIPKDFQRAALRRAAPTPVLVAHCEHDSRVPTSGADTLA